MPTANRSPLPTHAPRVGCDCFVLIRYKFLTRFNSRTPCGVRPRNLVLLVSLTVFQFTHPVWGATATALRRGRSGSRFNSRTPCGARQLHSMSRCLRPRFQLTHPVGVRQLVLRSSLPSVHVSIHAPHVGRDTMAITYYLTCNRVSIHAPRVGCDQDLGLLTSALRLFQFTHPMWGATYWGLAPRTCKRSFNSRTPCGARARQARCPQ